MKIVWVIAVVVMLLVLVFLTRQPKPHVVAPLEVTIDESNRGSIKVESTVTPAP